MPNEIIENNSSKEIIEKEQEKKEETQSKKKLLRNVALFVILTIIVASIAFVCLSFLSIIDIIDKMAGTKTLLYVQSGLCILCFGWIVKTMVDCTRDATIGPMDVINLCVPVVLLLWVGLSTYQILHFLYRLSSQLTAFCAVSALIIAAIAITHGQQETRKTVWAITVIVIEVVICVVLMCIQVMYNRIPDVCGKTITEAETALYEKDFTFELIDGSRITKDNRDWVVTEQDPGAYIIHIKISPVKLTVEKSKSPEIATNDSTSEDMKNLIKAIEQLADNSSMQKDEPKEESKIPDPPKKEEDQTKKTSEITDAPIVKKAIIDSIPRLSDIYTAIKTTFEPYNMDCNSRFGPGSQYAESGAFELKKCSNIQVYYCENDWVLTSLYYSPLAKRRWVYVKKSFIDNMEKELIPVSYDLKSYTGSITKETNPYWVPELEARYICDRYTLKPGTTVTAYFKDDYKQFVFAEFTCWHNKDNTKDKVRLWVPINCVDFGYSQ